MNQDRQRQLLWDESWAFSLVVQRRRLEESEGKRSYSLEKIGGDSEVSPFLRRLEESEGQADRLAFYLEQLYETKPV